MAQGVRIGAGVWLAAVMLPGVLTACGERAADAPEAPVLVRGAGEVASAHAFSIPAEDGTETRVILAGVATPRAETAPEAAALARARLEALLAEAGAGLSVVPAADGDSLDRYGRVQARAVFSRGAERVDVGGEMIADGWAVVWPRDGLNLPLDDFLTREADAREQARGAWGLGVFAVRDSDPDRLAQYLDSAQIVEGRVTSTGEARNGRVFLNFGADWRTDFTISASRSTRNRFEAAGIRLETLDGAVVRVRGWLQEENGPMITLTHPAQLDILDAPEPRTLR
ncbi:MAG: thermonuclease family protein [Oceanicaulis sp.]